MNGGLLCIGMTHQSAPLSIREQTRLDGGQQGALLAGLGELAPERMILSTCERFEVYARPENAELGEWLGRLARWFHLSTDLLNRHCRIIAGPPVAEHLLRVAAGLESRIIGEPQILRQVRAAFLQADEAACLGPILSALGRAAIHAGRRVRRETSINTQARSVATVAVGRVERELGGLEGKTVLILGSGQLAGDLVACLARRRGCRILVVSSDAERADALAAKFRGMGLSMARLREGIAQSAAVIACTKRPSFVLERSAIGRSQRLCIVDLGVPRNVDPAAGRMPGVRLIHLDELVGDEAACEDGIGRAAEIVAEELERFRVWHRDRRAAGEIAQLVAGPAGDTRNRSDSDVRAAKRALHLRIKRLKDAVAA